MGYPRLVTASLGGEVALGRIGLKAALAAAGQSFSGSRDDLVNLFITNLIMILIDYE